MLSRSLITPIISGVLLLIGQSYAKHSCPAPVTSSVEKAYPHEKISSCKRETEDGKTQYEVKIGGKGARGLELDVSPEGSILQTEKVVRVQALPQAVASAFETKYPTMKINRALEQKKADGSVSYELAFKDKMKKHEATFTNDGAFVEEE